MMPGNSVLEIFAYGAWNGGVVVDNSVYEKKNLTFKGGIPVNNKTIVERMGVRTRKAAGADERIGVTALQDLIDSSGVDPSRIKLVIGATNVGDDKYDPGPLIRYPYQIIRDQCPNALVFDLYAGCPGFNVAVELTFMLSLTGFLKPDDLTIIIGAENLHRAKAFKPDDTANIIFGDDSLATALKTISNANNSGNTGRYSVHRSSEFVPGDDPVTETAQQIFQLGASKDIDGIIIDNHLGSLVYRVPATAARVQHALVELIYPEEKAAGTFNRFKEALEFYDQYMNSFAFDIMTLDSQVQRVEEIAKAYVTSGKYKNVVSVYLTPETSIVSLHQGRNYRFRQPVMGVIDSLTRTHGCFADFIQAVADNGEIFGNMDGKGVFLYATRGAKALLNELMSPNRITLDNIDLLIEHQANFAMIPLTLAQVVERDPTDVKRAVADLIANTLVTNVHERGNCSVVCMQRLPYDLKRGALQADTLQGFKINRNLDRLKQANLILNDSVGSGMTRSAFLQRV
jgi:3-oxoacyl-[acyl-carrier-protein] synthase III